MKERGAQGFTLLELVVALAIAGLLLVLVLPTSQHRRQHDALMTSAHDIASALRLTRNRAIMTNHSTRFVVDVATGFYRPAGASAARPVPAGSRLTLYTAEDEQLGGNEGAIRFYPDGSSTGGGVALSLGGERLDVLVDWLTGGVSIHARAGG